MTTLVLYTILYTVLTSLLPDPLHPSHAVMAWRLIPTISILLCACYATYVFIASSREDAILSDTQAPLLDNIYVHDAHPRTVITVASRPRPQHHWLSHIPDEISPRHGARTSHGTLIPTPVIPRAGSQHVFHETVTKPIYASDVSDSEVESDMEEMSYPNHTSTSRTCTGADQIAWTQYISIVCVIVFWLSLVVDFQHLRVTSTWQIVHD